MIGWVVRSVPPDPGYPASGHASGRDIMRKVFIRCTKSELADFTPVSLKKISADPGRGTLIELPAGHVCQATMPGELARLVLGLAT